MKTDRKNDIYFAIYMAAVLILAIIYFTVPERKAFIDFQVKWWDEFLQVISSFFN